jgi:hypothetical protein
VKREREELIDLLLGELDPERAYATEERIAADPAVAAERELYLEAIRLTRAAAAEGWPAGRGRLRYLRPLVAAAAVLAVAVGVFLLGGPTTPQTIFEPDGSYGYLRPEETDSLGRVPDPSTTDSHIIRSGNVEVASLGSERFYKLKNGDEILPESEITAPAEGGGRIDLPHGGILFLAPLSTVQLRRREDGATALRLTAGEACTVAGERPLHLAVNGTDLLLLQESGSAFLRQSPSEVVCLRGDLQLRLRDRQRFRIPEGERLPGACANEPRTVPAVDEDLCLDWYRTLIYERCRVEEIVWERPGVSGPLSAGDDTLLFLRVVPGRSGTLSVRFGGTAREFAIRQSLPLAIRLRLRDLGPGPRLEVSPAAGVKEARLFEARPR